MVQEGYRGDNWLGLNIAGKKYYNIVDKEDRQDTIKELAKDLKHAVGYNRHHREVESNEPITYECKDFEFKLRDPFQRNETYSASIRFVVPSRYDIENATACPEYRNFN